MHRVLIVECQQEVSSFNPVPSRYADFQVHRGAALLEARRGTGTYLGGALGVLEQRADVLIVPVYGAIACSAGPLAADGFARLSDELLAALEAEAAGASAVYFALHGAMQADDELDPEGVILERARAMFDARGAVRDVARPARHRDRADVQALPGVRGAAHLSACRFRRHRGARRKAAAADPRRGAAAGRRRGSGCRFWCAATS